MAVDIQARGMANNALEYAKNIEKSGVKISQESGNIITTKSDGLYAESEVKKEQFNNLSEKVSDIELFKFPNAIIHGEPTINNGQISGFSNTNYLVLPSVFDLSGRGFEFKFAFTTKDDVTTPQNILGGKYCMALFIQNGKLNLRVSSNGTSWNLVNLEGTANIEVNKTYYIKINFTRLNYAISLSTDDIDYNEIGSVSVGDISPKPSELYIGIGNNFNNPFKGIINLNKCYLKVNQSIIWQGMDDAGLATRLATDLDNIDEEGIAKIKEIVGKPDTTIVEKIIAENWQGDGYNLIPFPYYDETTKTKDGITYTGFESGEVLAAGIGTSNLAYYLTQAYNFPMGTYRLSGCPKGGSDTTYYQYVQNADSAYSMVAKDIGEGATFTLDTDTRLRVGLYILSGYDANVTFKPMITKVAEDGSYPTEYQRYASSNVELTNEISQTELELAELKMLGWTVPEECPIKNKVSDNNFIQKVGRVDLGSLSSWRTDSAYFIADFNKINKIRYIDDETAFNGYSDIYTIIGIRPMALSTDKCLASYAREVGEVIYIRDSRYNDVDTFKNAMQGHYLYYELATPITMDITGATALDKTNTSLDDLVYGETAGINIAMKSEQSYTAEPYRAVLDIATHLLRGHTYTVSFVGTEGNRINNTLIGDIECTGDRQFFTFTSDGNYGNILFTNRSDNDVESYFYQVMVVEGESHSAYAPWIPTLEFLKNSVAFDNFDIGEGVNNPNIQWSDKSECICMASGHIAIVQCNYQSNSIGVDRNTTIATLPERYLPLIDVKCLFSKVVYVDADGTHEREVTGQLFELTTDGILHHIVGTGRVKSCTIAFAYVA